MNGPEKINSFSRIDEDLRRLLPDMKIEAVEHFGKNILICDYTPRPLPYDMHGEENPVPGDTEGVRYKQFWDAYQRLKSRRYGSGNVSSMGLTDLVDVREIRGINADDTVYLMPRSEWEKLKGKPFVLKNEKIKKLIRKNWSGIVREEVSDEERMAHDALTGENYEQLPAVISGLKPMTFEQDFCSDKNMVSLLRKSKSMKGLVITKGAGNHTDSYDDHMGHGHHSSYDDRDHGYISESDEPWQTRSLDNAGGKQYVVKQILYNPEAILRIVEENKDLFDKNGLLGKSAEDVVLFLEKDDASLELEGLILGYDKKSCTDYRAGQIDWSKRFMPPDAKVAHQINANPFNFYHVDYAISDEGNNPDFRKLQSQYDELVGKIEKFLEDGISAEETLLRLADGSDLVHAQQDKTRASLGSVMEK